MNANELKARFAELYAEMSASKDVGKMELFGTAFTNMFDKVATMHPDIATSTLDFLSAMEYNNYVTPAEAIEEASHFINDDAKLKGNAEPSRGARWNMDTAKAFLSQRGLALEEKPYYNWPALWLTMNMIYSDFADTLVELLGEKDSEKVAVASYKMAVKKLKDLDRPNFVREYFELE